MKRKQELWIAITITLLFPLSVFCQDIDSVKQSLAIQKDDSTKVMNYVELSFYYQPFNADSAMRYSQLALDLAETLSYEEGVFWARITHAGSLITLGNYPLSLDDGFAALTLAKKINTPKALSFANGNLAQCYYNLGDYSNSLQYEREVIRIAEHYFPDKMHFMWMDISKTFVAMQQPDSALFYAQKARHLILQQPNSNDLSILCPVLGNAFALSQQPDSALYYFHTGLAIARQYQFKLDLIENYNGLASLYSTTGASDSAILYAKKSLSENPYPLSLLKATNLLTAIYDSRHQTDSTLKYLRIADNMKDSLFNRQKTIAIQDLTLREKDRQQAIRTAQTDLKNRFQLYSIIAIAIFLLVIGGIYYRNKRQKQLQEIRNSIADDLHDDIGSVLSSIGIMNELAKTKAPEALPLLTTIGENTQSIQENMSDIVWAVNPDNDRFDNIVMKMNQYASEILEAKGIAFRFTVDPGLSSVKLSMELRKNCFLFFKECINNAAKHSGAHRVEAVFNRKDRWISLQITDDGKGFDPLSVSGGNGLTSLRKRATDMQAEYHCITAPGEGTSVRLRFKIT